MTYAVSEDFVYIYGSTTSVHTETKWRARREVVEWLTSLVSTSALVLAASINQPSIDTSPSLQSLMTRFSVRRILDESFREVTPNSNIIWSGDPWICSEQLKHYPAFSRSGTEIAVYSFVWVVSEEENDYLGYLEDLYEDRQGEKLVRVRRFHFGEEIASLTPLLHPHPREIFVTPYKHQIGVEHIDGLAAILTPSHFEKCLALLPPSLSVGCFACCREFRNAKVKPFVLNKLIGYSEQPILRTPSSHVFDQRNKELKLNEIECQKRGSKRVRSCRTDLALGNIHTVLSTSVSDDLIKEYEPAHRRLKIQLSRNGPTDNQLVVSQPRYQMLCKFNENVEVLCRDSGMRGCWFRCKTLYSSQDLLKVQYYDIFNADGPEKLEEWVSATRVAGPDILCVRSARRPAIRPWRYEESSGFAFEVGAAVDAWWCDGWWEGVVIGNDTSAESNLQVYFPGENRFLTIKRKNVRVSRDWKDDKWVSIPAKSDILSFLTSIFSSGPIHPQLTTLSEDNTSDLTSEEVCIPPGHEGSEDDEHKSELLGLQ
ncbi:hypothetical protein F511_05899 [Dorcoceras hygrometricum]|uniref:BAH domain-containing protein n=1 Tax=Dorcoceras hygrometricum TaxID=472368 RepID=A0A2Z7CVX8_9LAMI|nr:hypothetical protein F511_05899 [Dorcoceras hygrometricum]